MALNGSPSGLFDAVVVLAGPDGDKALAADPDAVGFMMDAGRHLKAIGLAGIPDLEARTQVEGVARCCRIEIIAGYPGVY